MSLNQPNNPPDGADPATGPELKTLTARSVKWNVIDRVSSQLLYAVTGVVLARLLDQDDFGLVGAMLVFQAFASLFVDSGFSYALIQRKKPTRLDYSTVLWFNLAVACAAYIILFFAAPLIADCFQGDQRLIPMSRVMFLSFILNASAIVQTNRLMKRMDVKMVAVSNSVGLFAGAVVGITLAVGGYGAWAIVWQTITLNGVKSLVLWLTSGWRPLMRFSYASLRSFFAVGWGMMGTSFLNTLFQNIYSFFVGNRAGLAPLGYYSQADKWSKMGITSISQVLTSSFLPALSEVQDDPERFSRVSTKMNRFTSYLLFPAMGFLVLLAEPIFHCLFGEKWDASIILFQLLLVRGIFTVLSSLYHNYAVAVARTELVMSMEAVRDVTAFILLAATLPFIADTRPGDPVWGIRLMLYGQLAASALSWAIMAVKIAPLTGRRLLPFLADSLPYLLLTLGIMALAWVECAWIANPWALLLAQSATALTLYLSAIQREVLSHLRR